MTQILQFHLSVTTFIFNPSLTGKGLCVLKKSAHIQFVTILIKFLKTQQWGISTKLY